MAEALNDPWKQPLICPAQAGATAKPDIGAQEAC
jgi:hypothetical protein